MILVSYEDKRPDCYSFTNQINKYETKL